LLDVCAQLNQATIIRLEWLCDRRVEVDLGQLALDEMLRQWG
jgi:hypothetical protein